MAKRYSDLAPSEGTTTKGHPARVHTFSPEGAKVKVPHNNGKGKHGKPIAKDLEPLGDANDAKRPGRLIINLAVEDPEDPNKFVNLFDPPFELRVRITPADIHRAGSRDKVRLVYWDQAQKHWEYFREERVSWDGDEMEVWIDEWSDDPTVGSAP